MSGGPQQAPLPRILIIDDQFGRDLLGNGLRSAVGEEVFALYQADRDNLCRNFGLAHAEEYAPRHDATAVATFCPAQRWDEARQEIVNDVDQAIAAVRQGWPAPDGSRWSLVLLDLRFTFGTVSASGDPERASMFGFEDLLPQLRAAFGPDLPIIVLSSSNRDEHNQRVREMGALDFIQRIPSGAQQEGASRNSLSEALKLHGLLPDQHGLIIGQSLEVLKMLRAARRGARSARTVLLEGETGSGKGLLARYIHLVSDRSQGPFESFNAAQRTADLQADELFGHWAGAFTDAKTDSAGVWERSHRGTLFIDEVSELDESVQRRLMDPIEERRVRRLGHPPKGKQSDISVDVLVVLATNRPLEEHPSLKHDFLNRINAFTVRVPPLRERREDIPALFSALASRVAPGWTGRALPRAMQALVTHDWQGGNVRELRNVVERALANNPQQDITAADLHLPVIHQSPRVDGTSSRTSQSGATSNLAILFAALEMDPDKMTPAEVRTAQAECQGGLPILLAQALLWALRVTSVTGKTNPTAAARFLLGRPGMTTLEAKQFLKKCLTLDSRGGSVWRLIEADAARPQSPMFERMLAELRQRDTRDSGHDG